MAKQESAGQPRLLELGPRKALVLVEEDGNASNRLALTINGEPVAPVRTIVRRDGVPNGVNLIADAVSHDAPPWRPVADAAIEASRVRDGKWGLPGGATVALRAASGVKGAAEYVTPDGRVTIRLGAAADYIFEGYFARHRCDASVQ
ncbi:MAG: hypothetical protein J0H62_11135, partial [Rhizobiales bacterium]|nr:hypothetical protein [Hyphomicrobiales bacterium]